MIFQDKDYITAAEEQADIDAFKDALTDIDIKPIPWTIAIYALLEKAAEIAMDHDDLGTFIDMADEVYDAFSHQRP